MLDDVQKERESNGTATMYFARENKGHAGIKDTPVENFGGNKQMLFLSNPLVEPDNNLCERKA